jgi:hypothetical protein
MECAGLPGLPALLKHRDYLYSTAPASRTHSIRCAFNHRICGISRKLPFALAQEIIAE